ncbi:hypothetical protein [Pseudomonas fragi]|nr:hypothetical protein [Pseudomonas fragi]
MITTSTETNSSCADRTFWVRSMEDRCSVFTHRTTDIDHQAASLTGWEQVYDQLSPGKYEGCLTEYCIDDLQLVREQANQSMHQMGNAWKGSRTFIIPMQQKGTARFGTQIIDAACPVTLAPERELDFRTPTNMDVMAVVVCSETISNYSKLTE